MLVAVPNGADDHVRSLLDQRAQRADITPPHARFSALSDRSDSPSLYSHFDSNYRNTPTTPAFRFPLPDDRNVYDDDNVYMLSPKERLADPNASSLDLSEDTYSEDGSHVVDLGDESNFDQDDGEDTETRMSLLGPKMRVHSRAPWEEDDGGDFSDSGQDDGGMDGMSIFGGRKTGRTVLGGLGFRSKSPAPRPSFESTITSKGKASFETTSSSSRSAIHALAQASMSTSSLALGPSPSANLIPHKLSVSGLAVGRDRSSSNPASAVDRAHPPLPSPSPRPVVVLEQSCRHDDSLLPPMRRSVSPSHSDFSVNLIARSPSPMVPESMHPYANPALLAAYQRDSTGDPFAKDMQEKRFAHRQTATNDSIVTLSASEETVRMSHSSSFNTVSAMSTSELGGSTPPTSAFSIGSAVSQPELSKSSEFDDNTERTKQQRRLRRETKLGPISGPTMISNGDFPVSTPYALISLEQAQARVKERNRSATTGTFPDLSTSIPVPFPKCDRDDSREADDREPGTRTRARTNSATKVRMAVTHVTLDNSNLQDGGDQSSPVSASSYCGSKQPSPAAQPGRTLKTKRSGFMKLFNGREKDKAQFGQRPPPVPSFENSRFAPLSPEHSYPPSTPRPSKVSTHRVPVPVINSTVVPALPDPANSKPDLKTKKSAPSLSIKVTSPPISQVMKQDPLVSRRSDSPKLSGANTLKVHSPKMPTSAPAGRTQFTSLSLRPVSGFFSGQFAEQFLSEGSPASSRITDGSSLISPTAYGSDDSIASPMKAEFSVNTGPNSAQSYGVARSFSDGSRAPEDDPAVIIASLREQLRASRKSWQRQVWELEGQVRDLTAEIEEMKSSETCEACGRGIMHQVRKDSNGGVIHRPRAKTGTGARFASGNEA